MKLKMLAFTIAFLLSIVITAQAQTEYTSNYKWIDAGNFRDQLAQHSPRIACSRDNPSFCVMLYYFSGDTFDTQHIGVKWSYDGFNTILGTGTKVPISIDYATSQINNESIVGNFSNYALPYDITWYNGDFWVIFDAGTSGNSYIYKFNPATSVWTQIYNTGDNKYSFLEIVDDNHEPKIGYVQASGANYNCAFMYLSNQTAFSTTVCGTAFNDAVDSMGFIAKNGANYIFQIKNRNLNGFVYQTNSAFYGSFPYNQDGMWYYDGSRVFFRDNSTVYYTTTSDFSTYVVPVAYYNFDNSIDQYINYTSYYQTTGKVAYGYRGHTNQTGRVIPFSYLEGVFTSQQALYPVQVWINYKDQNNATQFGNAIITISCSGYTTTATSTNAPVTLYTPCTTGNNLTIIATSLTPFFYSTTFDTLCNDNTIIYTSYIPKVAANITVIDNLRLTRVPNALVTVSGIGSGLTDSGGVATIANINPFSNVQLVKKAPSGCGMSIVPNGVQQQYGISVTKAGYNTFSQSGFTFGSLVSNIPFYEPNKAIRIQPEMGSFTVRLLTTDLKEINPVCANLFVYGSTVNVSYYYNGQIQNTTFANRFPATFYVDSSVPETFNLTLTYAGNTYTYPNFALSPNETKPIDWDLPFTSLQIPCCTTNDCPASYCDDRYNRGLTSCVQNVCTYTTADCLVPSRCDATGCFDISTSTNCTRDVDCSGTCYDNLTMQINRCGSTGFCIGNLRICDSFCNSTAGVCDELKNCKAPTITNGGAYLFNIGFTKNAQLFTQVGTFTKYFTCDFNNAGKSVCVGGGNILAWKKSDLDLYGLTIDNRITSPPEWNYAFDGSNYNFYDLSVTCDKSCLVTYKQCQYGCNVATGTCSNSPTSTSIKGLQESAVEFFNALAPDPLSKATYWTFGLMVWLVLITVLTKKWEAGALSGLGWALLGSIIAWYPWWSGIVFVVLATVFMANLVTKRYQLGG